MTKSAFFLSILVFQLLSCRPHSDPAVKIIPEPKRHPPKTIAYQFENAKKWLSAHISDSNSQRIAFAVNRTDSANFAKMDSIIVPTDFSGDIEFYLPFPMSVPIIKNLRKIIYFSYHTQTFAAYELGKLVRTGPTNMGREKDLTPTGLFYTNWKAEETTSSFNDEWDLRWNFNVLNKEGIGWHQYALPGYPASHSCLRLQERDARYLFDWADQWELSDRDSILIKGTPVIVFGNYNFKEPKPWLKLAINPMVLNIEQEEIEAVTRPYLQEMLWAQKSRESFSLKQKAM